MVARARGLERNGLAVGEEDGDGPLQPAQPSVDVRKRADSCIGLCVFEFENLGKKTYDFSVSHKQTNK